MDVSSDASNAPAEFLRLFRLGKQAAKRGDNAEAHACFRQAIAVDPYHAQVWLWLASVVDSDEDRRVCFENVLELDPDNATAHTQLARLQANEAAQDDARSEVNARRARRRPWFRLFLTLLAATAAAAVLLNVNVA